MISLKTKVRQYEEGYFKGIISITFICWNALNDLSTDLGVAIGLETNWI